MLGQRYGILKLSHDFLNKMNDVGYNISAQQSKEICELFLTLIENGLFTYGAVCLKNLGSLSVVENKRDNFESEKRLRIKYRQTEYLKKKLRTILE